MKTNIKVIELKSNKPGKNIVVLAGVHGNEICGIKAFDKLISTLKIDAGKVTFIYSNLEAIKQNKRFIEKNLNRCFFQEQDKDIKNSLEGKTAKEIIPYLEKADTMLDVHASASPNSQPFVICDESLIREANIFDVKLVVCNFDEFEPGSTDYYMNQLSKKGFGIECGYMDDVNSSEFAEKAIITFLVSNGCIKGSLNIKENQRFLKIINLYKNKFGKFIKSREFSDFELLAGKIIVGSDRDKAVYGNKGDILLFVRDRDDLNSECFLVAKEISKVIKYKITKIRK